MASGGGRHERTPEGGTGRRAVLIGGTALGVVAVGGGAAALVTSMGGGKSSGSSDGGSGGLLGGHDEETTTPAPPRRIFETLPDRASSVPETAVVDLNGLVEPRAVTYPRVPSARGFSEAVDMSVNKIIREHLWAGESAGDLQVSGTIVLSGADTLGALLSQQDAAGPSASLVYYRANGDRPFTSPGLIDPAQWGALGSAVTAAAKDVEGLDAAVLNTCLQQQPRPWGNGPAMLFDTDGDLHVVFPAASVNGSRVETDLEIPAATAAPLLSEDGRAVLAAATAPAAFDPATVVGAPADHHDGDSLYTPPVSVPAGQRARESDGAGPAAQLAPLSGSGVAPSAVAAPDATRLKAVALTFDDGPDPDKNQTLRDHLAEHRASCTFYMIGQSVQSFPEWCGRTAAAGLEVGSHSWSHAQLSAASGEKLEKEVGRPAEEIEKATGRRPYVMRPPYGARNNRSDDACGAVGQSVHIWDVDTLDWKTKNVEKNIAAVQKDTRRGSIVLMHEIHQSSVDSVPQILTWFDQNDYTTLTASELGQNQMWAGHYYMQGLVTHEIAAPAPAPSDAGGSASPSASPQPTTGG